MEEDKWSRFPEVVVTGVFSGHPPEKLTISSITLAQVPLEAYTYWKWLIILLAVTSAESFPWVT
jgi:hypothetical protein